MSQEREWKKYPDWTEFNIEEVMYGLHAPHVGIGIYTIDGKYSWPDPECTMKNEYESWVKHLTDNGYEIPEKYLNAYCEEIKCPTEQTRGEI